MNNLIKKIKSKKPLDRLEDEFVTNFLNYFLKKNFKIKKRYIDNKLKKKDIEVIVKNVRNELNKSYGQFWLDNKLTLESHRSTKERLDSYESLYKFIFNFTGKPKTILDLACGLNPLTYKLIGNDIYFISVELTDRDCDTLQDYFYKNNINGEVIKADLRIYHKFPEVDVCLMFKLLDSIENKGHKFAEYLIKNIKAKYLVVSFATTTVHNIKMNYPRRGWFEVMLRRLGLQFIRYDIHNEVFYIVIKK